MQRSEIEKLSKVFIVPAKRASDIKILNEDMTEIEHVERLVIDIDGFWKRAHLYICVTDKDGTLVMEAPEKGFGAKRIKKLRKPVNFEFLIEAKSC